MSTSTSRTGTGVPSVNVLKQIRDVKDSSRRDIFQIVLTKCVEKIVYTNRHTDKTFIIFEVPQVLIGYPTYDMRSCILFLKHELELENYLVDFIEPFYLYIDWGGHGHGTSHRKTAKFVNPTLPTMNPERLRKQTKQLLTQFPNADQIEYVYQDAAATFSKASPLVKGGRLVASKTRTKKKKGK